MADHLHSIPDGSRRSGTLLEDIRLESDGYISSVRRILRKEPLLAAMLVAVLVGIVTGTLARGLHPSPQGIELLGLLGELMIRSLKMLVLPLVAGCMVASVCALGEAGSGMGRTAAWTLGLFFATTCIAASLGVALGMLLHPGRNGDLSEPGFLLDFTDTGSTGMETALALDQVTDLTSTVRHAAFEVGDDPAKPKSPLDAFLKLLRDLIPDNIAAAATDMNILGIIFFSVFFGVALSLLGHEEGCGQIIRGVEAFNQVTAIIYVSPLGIASLIASSICRTEDLARTVGALATFIGVYLAGLALICLVLYPAVFWLSTWQSPLPVYRAFAQALVTVFGTDSSIATLPVTLRCASEHGISEPVARFVLPLGATINMNGTAFFEALTVIFIAQAHGVSLRIAQLCVIGTCAVLAAISAAAIPSAGLVTMVMVMQAANLEAYLADIGIIFALDWLLDRCRSIPNVLGDCFTGDADSLQLDADSSPLHDALIGSGLVSPI
ncbi:MAG: dicarboxylate amino acid cation sodium transporter [Trebouxia sp. A1-2]|nr:MAG: dicarboxylate amino acid cation sodium transporter [Trebouxia sp. A1-2]